MDKIRLHLIIRLSWREAQPKLTYNAQGKNNSKAKRIKYLCASFKTSIFRKSYSGKNIFKSLSLLDISGGPVTSLFPSFYNERENSVLKTTIFNHFSRFKIFHFGTSSFSYL